MSAGQMAEHEAEHPALSVESAVDAVVAAAGATAQGDAALSDTQIARLLTALSGAYAFRAEMADAAPVPVTPEATATAVVTTVCEMIRAININMFDLMMWFDRPRGR